MKLKQTIISRLQAERLFRMKLADGLGFTEVWIDKLIIANKDNGPLTTAKALQVIKQETGKSDSEILVEESEVKEQQS
jgi:hypothetical protein